MAQLEPPPSGTRLSLDVLIERGTSQVGRWTLPRWTVIGIGLSEDDVIQTATTDLEGQDNRLSRRVFQGVTLSLFKDGCESYWHNLQSERPFLFVICDPEEVDGMVSPYLVTANQDEANAHLESDDLVLECGMPPAVLDIVERFVVGHYVPAIKYKRKRHNWSEDLERGRRQPRK